MPGRPEVHALRTCMHTTGTPVYRARKHGHRLLGDAQYICMCIHTRLGKMYAWTCANTILVQVYASACPGIAKDTHLCENVPMYMVFVCAYRWGELSVWICANTRLCASARKYLHPTTNICQTHPHVHAWPGSPQLPFACCTHNQGCLVTQRQGCVLTWAFFWICFMYVTHELEWKSACRMYYGSYASINTTAYTHKHRNTETSTCAQTHIHTNKDEMQT
jgi:hypothetical protein